MIKKNILITGSKNTGKSTLVQKILQQFSTSYAGFQTIPFEIFEAGPTYLMRDLITKNKRLFQSVLVNELSVFL